MCSEELDGHFLLASSLFFPRRRLPSSSRLCYQRLQRQRLDVVLAAVSTAGLSPYESGTEGLDSHSMSSFLLQISRKLSWLFSGTLLVLRQLLNRQLSKLSAHKWHLVKFDIIHREIVSNLLVVTIVWLHKAFFRAKFTKTDFGHGGVLSTPTLMA